ncbi:response regulator NasT [Paenibacillus taihuensis]|uniref:Response regulator NasT n=1 Tax=Paenibacillus taihuensis TaxID=1156355 RepID=A0A3D9S8M1_9BACL|nr:ANTAR domain-containing protein [Paenibacillus taihuensis]REE89075.1 response regulator NasT [Paenibacillus taihuensis]
MIVIPKTILLIEPGSRAIPSPPHLQQSCHKLYRAATTSEIQHHIHIADATVLHVPHANLVDWQSAIISMRRLPIYWLCSEEAALKQTDWGYSPDGVLFPSMTVSEMKLALQWGLRIFQQRKHWAEEREQLMMRLEERKWIDQAKAVLCEVKGISEAEAYDFLRKQAMNERKRIGDIAASIVKVYQLIHG